MRVDVGICESIGARPYMEDRYSVDQDGRFVIASVFDGHGGHEAAEAGRRFLNDEIRRNLMLGGNVPDCIARAIATTDSFVVSASPEHVGTTLCCAVLDKVSRKIVFANVGDSRAVLRSRDLDAQYPEASTVDHKPSLKSEFDRITGLGGFFSRDPHGQMRVLGNLNLTRSLGDVYMRPFVSPVPDISVHETDDSAYAIIASDGFWDTVDPMRAFDRADSLMYVDRVTELDRVACILKNLALSMGSSDNVTVIVLKWTPS